MRRPGAKRKPHKMPWHLSTSDPRKLYDERHEVVCVCTTAEQARFILEAVLAGGKASELRLREPTTETPKVAVRTHSFEPDECCGRHIARAIQRGTIALDFWSCPACHCEWRPETSANGAVVHWRPYPALMTLSQAKEMR